MIEKLYEEFMSHEGRVKSTSISLEAGKYLWAKLEALKPKSILDTGSGFSTLIIRTWQKLNPGTKVFTTDLISDWLAITKAEAAALDLNTDNFYQHDEFAKLPRLKGKFDFVFIDLGGRKDRMARKEALISYAKKTGVLILDDWHRENYSTVMRPFLEENGYTVTKCDETLDCFNRYMVEAVRV